jgi:hypothetical protein
MRIKEEKRAILRGKWGLWEYARCWYRTSDPLRVKQVLYH